MNCSNEPRFLHEYFLRYAETYPDQLAILHNSIQWSYSQLADKSHNYAERLKEIGLDIGERVILEFDPSAEAIAIMIACSMLGLIFIPINPDTPQERLQSIINRTGAKLHIQKGNLRTLTSELEVVQVFLAGSQLIIPQSMQLRNNTFSSKLLDTNLVYIIFTSGTTGQPKGIMMTHRAVLSFFEGMNSHCLLPMSTRVGSVSSLQFDFSILDMGLAFGSGGTLVIVSRSLIFQPKRFLEHLHQQKVDIMSGVPSIWKNVLSHQSQSNKDFHLTTILYGGEYFSARDLRKLQTMLGISRIINCFGQSESIACSFKDLPIPLPDDLDNIPIGLGMHNVEMYLLNEKGDIIREPRVTGEIYLRGSCLFSGYWKEEVLTNSRLILHPAMFYTGEKIFKTGDLAYTDESGQFYYVSRADNQVKLSGYRVELEEVERRIFSHPKVNNVCLIAYEGEKTELHAFIVLHDLIEDMRSMKKQLRSYCAETLPYYMIPSEFIFLNEFPLNTNGKVDRNALKRIQDSYPALQRR